MSLSASYQYRNVLIAAVWVYKKLYYSEPLFPRQGGPLKY